MDHPSTYRLRHIGIAALILLLGLMAGSPALAGPANEPEDPPSRPSQAAETPVDAMVFETPPPPFRDPDIFPCSECHNEDQPPNPERRVLEEMHEEIVLRHDEEHRWCLDCHDAENRDQLRLANGTLIPFEESYRLCGQCHGSKFRDWRAGVHGRRTGEWDGERQYLLCVHCHYSHEPGFQPIAPKPAPMPPAEIK